MEGGVDWLQLRDRSLTGEAWLCWAEWIVDFAKRMKPDIRVIINRRIDVAMAVGADGIHLGFDALGAVEARAVVGPSTWIGRSTHEVDEIRRGCEEPLDYVQLAPIFSPLSKPAERPVVGLGLLRRASTFGIPLIAQGGIDYRSAHQVIRAGAAGIAVTGALLLSRDPHGAARELRNQMDRAFD